MTSLKILHVSKKYPKALGGDAVVVSNLQKHQEAAGHQVAILTSNCPEISNGAHLYKFGLADTPAALDSITPKRLVSLAALFFKAFVVLGKERPDVIHTHSVDMAFFVSFAARFFKIPLVHTFHIVTFYDRAQPPLRRKSELLLAKAAGLKAATAPNDLDVALLRAAGLHQAVTLPNGVDANFWRPAPAPARGRAFVCISVGRLEAQKGYEYLIKAAALLKKTSPQPFRVVIVGEGSQKDTLQKLARTLGVQDKVDFVGAKTPKQVRALLSCADVAVCTSLYETTPLTLLEAWAVGVPVITTPVGILQTVPRDTDLVYLVRPKDQYSLHQAIEACMNDKDLRMKVATAGHQEAKKYDWPSITKTAESLYRSVL